MDWFCCSYLVIRRYYLPLVDMCKPSSLDFVGQDNAEAAFRLETEGLLAKRSGVALSSRVGDGRAIEGISSAGQNLMDIGLMTYIE